MWLWGCPSSLNTCLHLKRRKMVRRPRDVCEKLYGLEGPERMFLLCPPESECGRLHAELGGPLSWL